jgi:hypothetical protein
MVASLPSRRRHPHRLAVLAAAAAALAACGPRSDRDLVELPRLARADEVFGNPERGFYTSIDLFDPRDLVRARDRGHTVVHAVIRLDAYRDRALPAELLQAIGAGFGEVRAAGLKVIPRFTYNDGPYPYSAPDAPEAVIHAHLGQLRPVLEVNADVLVALEAGFIGAWGEWHSSTHGLDGDLQAKNRILGTLLAAVPGHRMVALRFPTDIEQLVGELPEASAFSTAITARVGSHQDCFLGSEHDFGTWGRTGHPYERDKDFIARRGRFTVVGGETCAPGPRATCENALAELEMMHWSYLNHDFHPEVIARFRHGGCFAEIERRLGYRLVLRRAAYGMRDDRLHVKLTIDNEGYAAMFNPRKAFIVLERDGARFDLPLRADPRRWLAGEDSVVSESVALPDEVASGSYRMSLWLPDLAVGLRATPAYSVRLANAGAWQAETGLNRIGDVVVSRAADQRRDARGDDGPAAPRGALVIDDFDDRWPSANQLGRWSGANGFVNGGGWGEGAAGRLVFEYDNDGWFGSGIALDISRYRWLVLRLRGAAGGEERHIGLRLGGVDLPLGRLTGEAITTEWRDLRIDLERAGVNRADPAQLELYFWNGGSGRVELGRISLEP